MTIPFSIEEIAIPESADHADFAAMIEVRNAGLVDILGAAASTVTPAEMLPALHQQQYDRKRLFLAKVDGRVVASALLVWSLAENAVVAGIELSVLRAFRNQGIGTAMADLLEAKIRGLGRPVIQVGAIHEALPGETIPAATGFGQIPAADPGARFLRKRGFTLEQVYRLSNLTLPVEEATLQRLESEAWAKTGDGYRVHLWTGSTPEQWRDGVAHIFTRLPLDSPTGDLEIDPEPWDAERVRVNDERRIKSGRLALVAAVEHIHSGTLVAFNGLSTPDADRTRPTDQGITLVLKEHRGHRLGMLTKVANIRQLMEVSPESPFITTDNAEENRPMLDVNEAVGFRATGYEGVWQKKLS
jgi:GNAT superfamily N-acetyltransferase